MLRSFRRRPPPSLLLLVLPGVGGGATCVEDCEVGGVGGGTSRGGIRRSNDASPSKSLLVSAVADSLDCCSAPPSVHSLSSTAAPEHWGAARPSLMVPLPPPPPPTSLDSTSSPFVAPLPVILLPLLPILAGMLILRSEIDDPTPLKDLPACLTMDDDLLLTKDETAFPFFV